jgi:hypothetical protein
MAKNVVIMKKNWLFSLYARGKHFLYVGWRRRGRAAAAAYSGLSRVG